MAGASAVRAAIANFDCDDIYREHAFLVRLTKGREPKALGWFPVSARKAPRRPSALSRSARGRRRGTGAVAEGGPARGWLEQVGPLNWKGIRSLS
jgi:hypothetical protein